MKQSLNILSSGIISALIWISFSAELPAQNQEPTPTSSETDLQLPNPFNAPFSQQSFVPNISLILDTSFNWRNLESKSYNSLKSPFNLNGQNSYGHHSSNLNHGFNLNYAELTMESPVDPYFDMLTTFHLSSLEFEIEEAYIRTRGLPWNFQFKTGKFLSDFGRQNNQHAHFWSFSELPLIYNQFFGNEALNELGLQMNWLAPTDFYLSIGSELLRGTNHNSFGLDENNMANLFTSYIKTSFDIDNLVILGGLSYALGGTHFASSEQDSDEHFHTAQIQNLPEPLQNYTGRTHLLGADLAARYFINSYHEVSWQSEFIHRITSGEKDSEGRHQTIEKHQNGLYSQLLWRFNQQWRTGVRIDMMMFNQHMQDNQISQLQGFLPRYSAMLAYYPTEYSRFRLQFNHDRSQYVDQQFTPFYEISLQLNLAMGAHGAHEF